MKHFIIGILIFITTNCFAINQNMIDGVEKYKITIENLKETEIHIKTKQETLKAWLKDLDGAKNKTGTFSSYDMIQFYQTRVEETKNQINTLNIQYAKTKDTLKELEPIKKEYDKQIDSERKKTEFNEMLWRIIWYGTVLGVFAVSIFLAIFIYRRNQRFYRMVKDGKLSKEEYEKLMQSHRASTINSDGDSSFKTYGVRYGWWR